MGSIRNVLYGYSIEKGVIVLNREEAPIVFEAFNRYCDGEILKDIADSFTERGIAYYRPYRHHDPGWCDRDRSQSLCRNSCH